MKEKRINELKGLIIGAVGLIMLISLVSFSWQDLSLFSFPPNSPPKNWIRIFGAYLGGTLFFLFGKASYLISGYIIWLAIRLFRNRPLYFGGIQLLGFLILLLSSAGILSSFGLSIPSFKFLRAGILGMVLEDFLSSYFGKVGALIIFFTFAILSLSLLNNILISVFFLKLFFILKRILFFLKKFISKITKKEKEQILVKKTSFLSIKEEKKEKIKEEPQITPKILVVDQKEQTSPTIKIKKTEEKKTPPSPKIISEPAEYKLPSLDLLDLPPPLSERKIQEDLTTNVHILEETLADFGISAKVTHIERGPIITRYELEPAAGVKLQKIVSLSDDIALALKAQSVRVVAPIPGKGRVGVEVPNSQFSFVYLREVLSSAEYQESDSKLTLAIGKDITGKPVVVDLGELPHLLIAGTTGSGKTVCLNSLILSLLFRASPWEVKFIMVDPKRVELSSFNDLPHLLCPVLTETKKVSLAFNWLVNEMENRYKLFAKVGTRNIEAYNEKQEKIPYIVVVVDELADLMVVAREQMESAIMRLAQLARAVGIHLILATQRPSVDVITGVIKANFPARISFKVASKVDSRTVLDMNGADKLLGKGDLLFLRPSEERPIRAQGCLVTEKEIQRCVDFIRKQCEPLYEEELLQENPTFSITDEKDQLYPQAVRIVMETGQASASILQRRLRIGYTRAARIIDMMEQEGLLGPFEGSKPRKILVDREDWLKKNILENESN